MHEPPSLGLRDAMALAALRGIARQYRDGFAEAVRRRDALAAVRSVGEAPPVAAVQRLYLGWLASAPDSHGRKHGEGVAHSVIAGRSAGRHGRRPAWCSMPNRAGRAGTSR